MFLYLCNMTELLIKNTTLVQVREQNTSILKGELLRELPILENAWIRCQDDRILDFGTMDSCPPDHGHVIDAKGRFVFPSWCDSHTHLVFAAYREQEFVQRISGMSYAEIAAKGGGILNSARRLRAMSEAELFQAAHQRLDQLIKSGTGAIEIKSGYGLSAEGELKMLRVIKKLKKVSPIPIKASFLGAHALPKAFKENREGYMNLLINELLPIIAKEELANYVDIFCEKGFYSVGEAAEMMAAGNKYGLRAKIHTNQFNSMGGIQAAIAHNALSVDHLEVVNEAEILALTNSNVIPTLLPSAPFFLQDHYPPARQLIDAGLPVTLASDFNPGTSPSGKMAFVVALACIKMKMLPNEAINAATLNGAAAMELENDYGSITKGKKANLFITQPMPSIAYLPYGFTEEIVDQVIVNGQLLSKALV